jgi:hypothetical protein
MIFFLGDCNFATIKKYSQKKKLKILNSDIHMVIFQSCKALILSIVHSLSGSFFVWYCKALFRPQFECGW